MTDFMPQELPHEVAESMNYFDENREKFYKWLGIQAARDVSVFSYESKTGELVSALTEIFAETAVTIVDSFDEERQIAAFFISRTWIYDSEQRSHFISDHLPYEPLPDGLDRLHIEHSVNDVLSTSIDHSHVYNEIGTRYFTPLAHEIGSYLTGCLKTREERIMAMTAEMPLNSADSVHFEPRAEPLSQMSSNQQLAVLRKVIT